MWLNWWTLIVWSIALVVAVTGSWGSPGDGQYHIQTDEGPERYFRFQTDNGQFRKERRLQDGTVVGTEAWIDAAGILRAKDYIADKEGYRILKSKTVYVGYGRRIEDAIKSTKTVPSQSGVLVAGKLGRLAGANNIVNTDSVKQSDYAHSTTTTSPLTEESHDGKLNYLSPAAAANIKSSPYLGFDHYPDELPRLRQRRPGNIQQPAAHPNVYEPLDALTSNSIADDYRQSQQAQQESTGGTALVPVVAPPLPSLSIQPPFHNSGADRRRVRPIAIYATTPAPISNGDVDSELGFSTPAPFVPATADGGHSTNGYHYQREEASSTDFERAVHPFEINQLEDGLLPPPRPHSHRRARPLVANTVADAADYDGIGATSNGFGYFLPRQYHEEEQFEGDKRAGSFGYVDPFGIRRVVYYNSSPGNGFVHRNNNRYVGIGATPYDPVV